MIEPIGTVVAQIDGSACEIEYRNNNGEVVGSWAYGAYDPSLPYQGASAVQVLRDLVAKIENTNDLHAIFTIKDCQELKTAKFYLGES